MNDDVAVTPDGRSLVLTRTSLTQPAEIYRAALADGTPTQLTHANDCIDCGTGHESRRIGDDPRRHWAQKSRACW